MEKEVLGNMLPFSRVSMVSLMVTSTSPSANIFLQGCAMILARSFARIHETNLKVVLILPVISVY